MRKDIQNGFLLLIIYSSIVCLGMAHAEDPVLAETPSSQSSIEGKEAFIVDDKPIYTLEEAEAILNEMIAWVERITEKKFNFLPRVELISREKMIEILIEESKTIFKNLYPGLSEEQVERLNRQQSTKSAMYIVGNYNRNNKKIYLVPSTLIPFLKLHKLENLDKKPIIKLVIAHELTHALQDQRTSLSRIEAIKKRDELKAFKTLFEGHAVFVEERICQAMGLEKILGDLLRSRSLRTLPFEDPFLNLTIQIENPRKAKIYSTGKKFIEFQYIRGGNQKVWEVLANPPVNTFIIAYPETYGFPNDSMESYASLFKPLERRFTENEWDFIELTTGLSQLRFLLSYLSDENRETVLSHISRFQAFSAQHRNPNLSINISFYNFDNGHIPKQAIFFLEEMVSKSIERLESNNNVDIIDFLIEDITDFRIGKARKQLIVLFLKDKKEFKKESIYRIFRENVLVEIQIKNFELDKEEIGQIIQNIFSKIDQLSKK